MRDLVHAQGRLVSGSSWRRFFVALVTGAVAWIMGMLQAADEKRWGWFVTVLLLGAVGSLAYGLKWPAAAVGE
jgi:uncharacterized membrane protein YiaA